MRAICIAALLAVSLTQARAETFAIMGEGALTCGQFAAQYKADPRFTEDHFYAWTMGFMSGANTVAMSSKQDFRDLKGWTTNRQMGFLRLYCDNHPLLNYGIAVIALYKSLPVLPARTD